MKTPWGIKGGNLTCVYTIAPLRGGSGIARKKGGVRFLEINRKLSHIVYIIVVHPLRKKFPSV